MIVLVIAAIALIVFGVSQFAQAGSSCIGSCNQGYCCTQNLSGGTVGLIQFAGGIGFAEGYWDRYNKVIPENRPARDNNPGDLIGIGDAGSDGAYRKYSTADAGWQALYNQLNMIVNGSSKYYTLDMTISQMAHVWTQTQPDMWAANVASYIGGSVTDTLRQWLT